MVILLISIIIIMFIISIYILRASEKNYISNIKKIEKSEKEIDEEMVIHQALERAGAMPAHHHKEERIKHRNEKRENRYYTNLFYLIGYSIIFVEIWYLYLSIKELIKS